MQTQSLTNPFLVPNPWDKVGQTIGDFRFGILDSKPEPETRNPRPGSRTVNEKGYEDDKNEAKQISSLF
jgi:hypothetical protein